MKVKINNRMYEPETVVLFLSQDDKKNIANMHPDATKYLWSTREDATEDDLRAMMVEEDNLPEVVYMRADDWEGLYIDGLLRHEGQELGEGMVMQFWIDLAGKYQLTSEDIKEARLNGEGEEWLMARGSFPEKLSDLEGLY
jgi:hypothetical protein